MGEKASISVEQIADAGLQITGRLPSTAARRIAQLKSEAIEAPERRADIIQTLEAYAATGGRTGAASRAVATIMAVSMLEILQGD